MQNLIQAELDMVEEHVISCLFGNPNAPQVNSTVKMGLSFLGKNPIQVINLSILQFEDFIKPFLKENGYVDGNKLAQLIEIKFNKQIPIGDFRMIEFTRAIEPWLKMLGSYIQ